MKNFRTYQLAVKFYHSISTLKLPRHLKDQLERAASSVALNLAEGSGRKTAADQVRFYNIAYGSIRECQSVLDLAKLDHCYYRTEADCLAAHIYCLIRSKR